ncbi:MAG: murein biosynthesis integral membrane protein MurJ [Microbacteriaceae bacterium]
MSDMEPAGQAEPNEPEARKNWAKASAVMAAGTVVSRVLGFLKAMLLTATIGVTMSGAADAFALANKLPNNIYAIIIGGLLNAVLVPQIVRAGLHKDGGQRFINRLLTLFITVFGAMTVLATLASPFLVLLYAGSSASLTGDTIALATSFAYWCMPQIFFYALYTVLGEVLNARNYFGPYMWTPVLNNLIGIAGLVAFLVIFGPMGPEHASVTDWTASQITLLGGSATIGVAAQAILLFFFWKKVGLGLKLDFHWRGTGFRRVGKAYSWTFGSLLVMQGAGLISTQIAFYASGAGASVAALDTAWLVVMLPHSIAVVSITTTFFTRISEDAAKENWDRLKENLTLVTRVVGLLSVISSLYLIVVALPFGVLFTGGFEQGIQFGEVIMGYAAGLIFYSFVYVLQRTFFALEDTKTPFMYNLIYVAWYLIGVFACLLLPLERIAIGIAVVTSVGMLIQSVAASLMLRRKIRILDFKPVVISYLRYIALGAVSAVLGLATFLLFGGSGPGSYPMSGRLEALLVCAVVGVVMLGSYLVLLKLSKSSDLRLILASIRR